VVVSMVDVVVVVVPVWVVEVKVTVGEYIVVVMPVVVVVGTVIVGEKTVEVWTVVMVVDVVSENHDIDRTVDVVWSEMLSQEVETYVAVTDVVVDVVSIVTRVNL